MMWVALILGTAVLAILRKESFPTAAKMLPPGSGNPPATPPAVAKAKGITPPVIAGLDFTNPDGLMDAAKQAQAAGYAETAKALASRAQDLGDVVAAVTKGGDVPIKSALPGVTDGQWSAFVALFRGRNPAEVSSANQLGLFNIGFLRLRDLGLATNVFQREVKGTRVWDGKFIAPMTLDRFLGSPALQYTVFQKDMQERVAHIRAHHAGVIGKTIEGQPATLSGLLAAIKLAGTKGFDGWAASPSERKKFANTTAAYRTANGVF